MPVAAAVAGRSLAEHSTSPIMIDYLLLPALKAAGLYTRPTDRNDGQLWDVISDAPMATEFAISRFLVPYLSNYNGWSLFCDSDFLFFGDIAEVFNAADPSKAVMVVKHKYDGWAGVKMDGQKQTAYAKKNWSSFMLFNCAHPKNKYLNPRNINVDRGIDLHQFFWLNDEDIGEIHPSWNWLEGHSNIDIKPNAVHFTRGTPDMKGYENVPYAEDWLNAAKEFSLWKQAF